MANNPHPTHITEPMWWFIEQWEILEPETVFAGAWGNFKPGYHCDAFNLTHKGWLPDYSLKLPDDLVMGTWLENYGAAIDITFPSAQNGNYTNIRKYSDRIKAAWKARDPRLKGWREVLCNCSDGDSSADGFDIPGHYERTPDDTHKWHIHFSVLRKYVNDLVVYEAMMSILKGETLAQWEARGQGGVAMAQVFLYNKQYWISRGDGTQREVIPVKPGVVSSEMNVVCDAHKVYPGKDSLGYPTPDLTTRDWNDALVDLTFGKVKSNVAPPAGLVDHEHSTPAGKTGPVAG